MAPRKLGRSSTALFQAAAQRVDNPHLFGVSSDFPRLVEIELDRIRHNPEQPRKYFDPVEMEALAESIKRHGLKQPILVQDQGNNIYVLVAGERRYRAHQMLGRNTIYAIITEGDPDELALVENLQRTDLDALELAGALDRLARKHGYTHEALGSIIGRSQAEVSRTISLLTLPEQIRHEYMTGWRHIAKSVLIEIAAVADEPVQLVLWEQAKAGATVKALREAKRQPRGVAEPSVFRLIPSLKRTAKELGRVREHGHELDDAARDELRMLRQLIDELLEP